MFFIEKYSNFVKFYNLMENQEEDEMQNYQMLEELEVVESDNGNVTRKHENCFN